MHQSDIIICADDFGLNGEITDGIIDLLECNVITATSIFSGSLLVRQHHDWIHRHRNMAHFGLHFNLTEKIGAGTFWSLPKVMLSSKLRLISKNKIVHQLDWQIKNFADTLGFLPDYIDGHQHIHAFPVIRTALMDALYKNYDQDWPWIRGVEKITPGGGCVIKEKALKWMSSGFSRELTATNNTVKITNELAGMYDFNPSVDFSKLLLGWIECSGPKTILMVHPAIKENRKDPIGKSRLNEYLHLKKLSKKILLDKRC